MKLENGYKLIYEVIDTENGTREFKVSKENIPTKNDETLASIEIGANKLVYQYKNMIYGTGDKLVPTYNEDGTPADTQLITNENFAKVFVTEETDESGDEQAATSEANNETPVEVEAPDAGDEPPVEDPAE